MSRLAPGHSIQQGVDTATQAFGVSRRLGARRCRLWLADAAGKAGTFIASLEWESMAARGRGFDKFQDDPQGQSVMENAYGPNPTFVTVSHEIFTELQI